MSLDKFKKIAEKMIKKGQKDPDLIIEMFEAQIAVEIEIESYQEKIRELPEPEPEPGVRSKWVPEDRGKDLKRTKEFVESIKSKKMTPEQIAKKFAKKVNIEIAESLEIKVGKREVELSIAKKIHNKLFGE